ncbi:hypothetical protein D3C87_83860 [compost metagenome]
MTTSEIILTASVYFLLPILGLLYFVHLRDKMVQSGIPKPPVFELLLVFAIYGILLITLLTGLFFEWSAAAFLGTFFSVFIAPILQVLIYVRLKMISPASSYHLTLQKAALYYFIAFPISLFILFSFAKG